MNDHDTRSAKIAPASPTRRGFSLVELVVAVAISSILVMGLSSTIFLASRAIPNAQSGPQAAIQAGKIINQLATELESARYITELTATTVGFTVPDRNGDGIPERIRYAWSGVSGGSLTRQYNGGSVTTLADKVDLFTLTPTTTSVAETYPGSGVEDTAESLLVNYNGTSQLGNQTSSTTTWLGQYFKPTLAANVYGWRPTRVQFMAQQKSVPALTLVQMRPANASLTPTSKVLEQCNLTDAMLTLKVYTWQQFSFTTLDRLAPDAGICLVLQSQTGQNPAIVESNQVSGGMLKSNNGAWSYDSSHALQCQLYGKLTTSGGSASFNSTYLTSMTIGLRIASTAPLLQTTGVVLNHPELLSGLWELKFDKNPTTIDINGDASLDWVVHSGGNFDTPSLVGGVWTTSSAVLDTSPGNDFAKTTVVDLRCRNTTVGGNGATFSINALRSGAVCAPIVAYLMLQADGTQTLVVAEKLGPSTTQEVINIAGLPNQTLDLHLVIDPATSGISVTVNSVQRGTFPLSRITSSDTSRSASIGASGSTAQFTYARIRVLNE